MHPLIFRLRRLFRPVAYALGYHRAKMNALHDGLKETDFFVGCYVRSGSTWLECMLYELITGETIDFDTMKTTMPMVGAHEEDTPHAWQGHSRILKTHLPFRKEYKRGIYLMRDPRDVAVSEFKYHKLYDRFPFDLDHFIQDFASGALHGEGSWADHVQTWIHAANQPENDIFVLKYEELKGDPVAVLRQIAEKFDIPATDEQLEKVVEDNTIEKMRKREDSRNIRKLPENSPLRVVNKGKTGGYRTTLSENHLATMQKHMGATMEEMGYH